MARYSNQAVSLVAGVEVPLAGVTIYVYNQDESLAALTEDGGGALANPVTSDQYGNFHFTTADGLYNLEYHYGGKQIYREDATLVGTGIYNADQLAGVAAQVAADKVSTTASAAAALSSQSAAAGSAATATAAAATAAVQNTQAQAASLASGFYPAARSNVPRGATGVGAITAGSGGTNGTFALAFSGGNFAVNPTGTFTVAGGAVTAITVTGPGLYIGASPTAPTLVFSASAGLSGAAATLTVDYLVTSGRYYWTDHATDASLGALYQNVSGTATATSPLQTYPKVQLQQAVPTAVGGAGNAITMTPAAGYAVSGTGQLFFGYAAATNSTAFTVAITGINSGSATPVVMANGEPAPINILKTNYPFMVQYDSALTKFILVFPSQPFASVCLCDQVSGPANVIVAQSMNSGTMIARTSLADTEFAVKVTGNATIGSKSITINDASGNAIISGTPIYEVDGTAPGAGAWGTGDTIRLRYSVALSGFVRQRSRDEPNSYGILVNRTRLLRPLKQKPYALLRASNKRLLLTTFVSGGGRQDYAVHEFVDQGSGMGISSCWSYNGVVADIDGLYEEFANFTGEDTGGGIMDSLQPPTWEPVPTLGVHASYPTGFGPVGPGHGHLQSPTVQTCYADGDSLTNYFLLGNLPVGAIVRCATSLVMTQTFPTRLPDDTTAVGSTTYVHTAVTGGVRITSSLPISGTGIGMSTFYGGLPSGRGDTVKGAGVNAIAANAEDGNNYGLSGGVKTLNADLGQLSTYQIHNAARNTHILEGVLNQAGPVNDGSGWSWSGNAGFNNSWLQDRTDGYAKVYIAGVNRASSRLVDGLTFTADITYRVRKGALV